MFPGLVLAIIIALLPGLAVAQTVELVSVFHWERKERYFGGMSGIDVARDGSSYVGIGDNGQVLMGRIEREGDQITGATSRWIGGLRTQTGDRVGRGESDSEGIDLRPDGSFYISYERKARIAKYSDWEAPAFTLPSAPFFRALDHNFSLESVAVSSNGLVFTMPERALDRAAGHPVYVFDGLSWKLAGRFQSEFPWLVVGADFDDRDRLYVLERRLQLPYSFANRVRRYSSPFGPMQGVTLIETEPGQHDNLEGLSVWTDAAGNHRILMVSDDNHRSFQRTELVEYRVHE